MDAFYSLPLTGLTHQRLTNATLPLVATSASNKPPALNWSEPAITVLDDFAVSSPVLLREGTSLASAEAKLLASGDFEALILTDNGLVAGVLALQHIHSRATLKLAHQQHLRWEQLSVQHAMTPVSTLPAIAYSQLKQARIGDVVATLQQLGNHYLLVHTAGAVRGIISALAISRLTQESIPLQPPLFPLAEQDEPVSSYLSRCD